jgi:hypothetical protein
MDKILLIFAADKFSFFQMIRKRHVHCSIHFVLSKSSGENKLYQKSKNPHKEFLEAWLAI